MTTCHSQCSACCIAPTISSALPNMPLGKPAGVPCVNLDEAGRCSVYAQRPEVCRDFMPDHTVCGSNATEALRLLGALESATQCH